MVNKYPPFLGDLVNQSDDASVVLVYTKVDVSLKQPCHPWFWSPVRFSYFHWSFLEATRHISKIANFSKNIVIHLIKANLCKNSGVKIQPELNLEIYFN